MKISFVIPSFNCAVWLPHAVESVIKQQFSEPIEIVIVNDGSTDSTKQYLDWLDTCYGPGDRRRPCKIIHTENRGRCKARNTGLANASGDFIFMLDADDYCAPDRVKKTLPLFQRGAQYVYGSAEVMDLTGTKTGVLLADVFNQEKALADRVNRIVHSTVAFTRDIAVKFPYLEDREISDYGLDDWEHQLRLAYAGVKMDFVPSVLVAYRVLQSAISQRRDQKKVDEIKSRFLEKPVAA